MRRSNLLSRTAPALALAGAMVAAQPTIGFAQADQDDRPGENLQSDTPTSESLMPVPTRTVVGSGFASSSIPGQTASAATADYPTIVSADYVFGCMATNGQNRIALEQCSCSFDVVASLITYPAYVEASTFLSMGQVTGEKGVLFKSSAQATQSIGDLRRAQAEAEVRCFE